MWLAVFMDEPVVQFVAIADVRKDSRENMKNRAEAKIRPRRGYVSRLPRNAPASRHRRRADRHR